MYPVHVEWSGMRLEIWDLVFLLGSVAGYFVLRSTLRAQPAVATVPTLLAPRYLVTLYVTVLGAQLFSYAFDFGTTFLPPPSYSWGRYYLNPLAGPKTLYGAILILPLAVFLVWLPWRDLRYRDALDAWTPAALFAVLTVARLGCFLQGCCYGIRSETFGISLATGSVLYHAQLEQGLIAPGEQPLATIPTQAIEAAFTLAIGIATGRALRAGRTAVFPWAVAAYSVGRFAIEYVRDDPARNALGPLSTSQWVAVAMLLLYLAYRSRPLARVTTDPPTG